MVQHITYQLFPGDDTLLQKNQLEIEKFFGIRNTKLGDLICDVEYRQFTKRDKNLPKVQKGPNDTKSKQQVYHKKSLINNIRCISLLLDPLHHQI